MSAATEPASQSTDEDELIAPNVVDGILTNQAKSLVLMHNCVQTMCQGQYGLRSLVARLQRENETLRLSNKRARDAYDENDRRCKRQRRELAESHERQCMRNEELETKLRWLQVLRQAAINILQ